MNSLNSYWASLGLVALGVTACAGVKSVGSGARQAAPSPMLAFINGILPDELNEASGVVPLEGLPRDEVLIVGDKDLVGGQIDTATQCFNTGNFAGHVHSFSDDLTNSIAVNDMEDVAWDKEGRVAFVVISGSKNSSNERKPKREKFLRLSLDMNAGRVDGKEASGFKDEIVDAFPELKPSVESNAMVGGDNGTFNMEGAAFIPGTVGKSSHLLLGFRSPTHLGDAIVITVTNPHEIFDGGAKPQFEKKPLYLDLKGQGIRGLFYDDERKGCWITSGESANSDVESKEDWKLWFWDMKSAPVEKMIERGGLKNAEGVCRMQFQGKPGLLLIEDAGKDATGKPLACHYVLAPLPQ